MSLEQREVSRRKDVKYIFFCGKGGVGKTSMASSAAIAYAKKGYKTLIVTTDPAPNLGDIFECEIGHRVRTIMDNLWAMEIDPDVATEEYKNGVLEPMRQILPENVIKIIEEQLSSPCTEEVAAFDKFVDFMNDSEYDVVIFDTAPTGHTLRLLELPLDWKQAIEVSEKGSGQTCIGPVKTLQESRAKYEKAIELMRGERTEFAFVLQPDFTSLAETKRSIKELEGIGVKTNLLIVNGILPKEQCVDPFFGKRREMQEKYLKRIENEFPIPIRKIELMDSEIKGLEALERLGGMVYEESRAAYTP